MDYKKRKENDTNLKAQRELIDILKNQSVLIPKMPRPQIRPVWTDNWEKEIEQYKKEHNIK